MCGHRLTGRFQRWSFRIPKWIRPYVNDPHIELRSFRCSSFPACRHHPIAAPFHPDWHLHHPQIAAWLGARCSMEWFFLTEVARLGCGARKWRSHKCKGGSAAWDPSAKTQQHSFAGPDYREEITASSKFEFPRGSRTSSRFKAQTVRSRWRHQ